MSKTYVSQCYCTNARRAARAITEMYDDALRPLGLTVAQYYLLINISRLEPVDTSRLAGHVGLERSTLVRNVRLLRNNGWVEDRSSGQKHQFQLTVSGRRLLAGAMAVWEEIQADFNEQMGLDDADALQRLLRKAQDLKWRGKTT